MIGTSSSVVISIEQEGNQIQARTSKIEGPEYVDVRMQSKPADDRYTEIVVSCHHEIQQGFLQRSNCEH